MPEYWLFISLFGLVLTILRRHVRTTYNHHHNMKITTVWVPSSELGLYQPLSRQWVRPSPQNRGEGGTHSPAGEGLGESQFRRLGKSLALCLLCVLPSPEPVAVYAQSPYCSRNPSAGIHNTSVVVCSNDNASETKANGSFDNSVFFDIEVKRTPSLENKLFSKRSEHIR